VPEPQGAEAELSLCQVQYLFAEMEKQFSRFHNDSELSKLNQSAGQEFRASLLLYEIVEAALSSARLTGGIFDPTILPNLIAAGYDRSFELIKRSRKKTITNQNPSRHTWQDILMDPKTHSIYLPEGYNLDLGGIGKGWTVDLASQNLDEFQNYATESFVEMLSEARKYKLNIIIVEQSTSQQFDQNLVDVILANVAIVICFRTANPADELIILGQFAPFVKEGEIMNLPWFHFFIKIYEHRIFGRNMVRQHFCS